MEDSQIIDLYWARLEQAIQETDTKYGGYCRAIAHNILKSMEDSEECVSDTWLRAWERDAAAAAFGSLGVFGTHHAQPLARPLQSRARGKTRRKQLSGGARRACRSASPAGGSVEQTMDERELGQAIDRFLRTIPEKQCSLFLRRYWYAESISQIAERYSLKENTVKSILFRTREQLRKFLQKEGVAV